MTAQPNTPPPHLQPVEPSAPGEMTLLEHLKELRNRVFVAGLAVLAGVIICGIFWETIFGWLLA